MEYEFILIYGIGAPLHKVVRRIGWYPFLLGTVEKTSPKVVTVVLDIVSALDKSLLEVIFCLK